MRARLRWSCARAASSQTEGRRGIGGLTPPTAVSRLNYTRNRHAPEENRQTARRRATGGEMLGRMMVSALALTGVAYAQTPAAQAQTAPAAANTGDRVAYDAAFFAQFNPQNALDMVSQTPGFSLNGGADRRGFSGAVGNLLIDGERPVAKSQSVQTILQN